MTTDAATEPERWEIARDEVLAQLDRLHSERPASLHFYTQDLGRRVLVGLALRGKVAGVLAVDRTEWDGMRFLALAGVDMTPAPQGPGVDQMRQQIKGACLARRTKEKA